MNDNIGIDFNGVISILGEGEKILKEILHELTNIDSPVIKWCGGKQPDGTYHISYPVYHPVVDKFWESIHPLISYFNYQAWPEFRNNQYIQASFYKNASIEDISRGITAISRGERFCDGYWEGIFTSDGPIKTILERILVLID